MLSDNNAGHLSAEYRPDGSVQTQSRGRMEGSSADVLPQGSVFSRVQTPDGSLRGLNDDTIVSGPSIPGDAMKLSHALAGGFVIRNSDGSYSDPTGKKSTPTEQVLGDSQESTGESDESEGHPDLQGEPIASEESLVALLGNTDGNDQLTAVNQIVDTGEVSDELVNHVASNLGIEPEALNGQLGTMVSEFESQARATIDQSGIDSEVVLEWARENDPDTLRQAMMDQATKRTTSGYTNITQRYVEQLDTIDPDAILNANLQNGLKAHKDDSGRIVLTDSLGRSFEWRNAVRGGLVSVA